MKSIFSFLFVLCFALIVFNVNSQEVKINTNFVVEDDGTTRLDNTATVFDDMFGDISKVKVRGSGLSLNELENTIDFLISADTDDYAIVVYQMSHKWKMGSTIYPHIHWVQEENKVPNFLIQYRWQKNGEAKTTTWTNYKCNTTSAFTYDGGSLNQITRGSGLTPPTGFGISDIIQIRIIRDSSNGSTVFSGNDPYTQTVSISSVDCHIEIDTQGSRGEYSK